MFCTVLGRAESGQVETKENLIATKIARTSRCNAYNSRTTD